MAAVDRIYGNKKEAEELYLWLLERKEEIQKLLNCNPLNFLYYNLNRLNHIEDNNSLPLSNFPACLDYYLYKYCDLKFIQNRLMEQYDFNRPRYLFELNVGIDSIPEKKSKKYKINKGIVYSEAKIDKLVQIETNRYQYDRILKVWDDSEHICCRNEQIFFKTTCKSAIKRLTKECPFETNTEIYIDDDRNSYEVNVLKYNTINVEKFNFFLRKNYRKPNFEILLKIHITSFRYQIRPVKYYLFKFLKKYDRTLIKKAKEWI